VTKLDLRSFSVNVLNRRALDRTAARDVAVVFSREIIPQLRNPTALILGMMQPLVFLILFGPVLGGVPAEGDETSWQWFTPGILVMVGLFGMSSSGYALLTEINTGSFERMLVTPLNRTAMLIGKIMKEGVTLLAQVLLIILAVLPFGFELFPVGAILGLLLLVTFGLGLGGLSFVLSIASKKNESLFYVVHQMALFPLFLLAGVLMPMEYAPSWLYGASRVNPLTYVVEAERALFAGELAQLSVLYGLIAAVATAAIGLFLGTRAMRRAAL
jgi:ABC-2 type transport system permease protein